MTAVNGKIDWQVKTEKGKKDENACEHEIKMIIKGIVREMECEIRNRRH